MWQPGWEGSLEENGYVNMYDWVSSLFTWSYRIVNWLFSSVQLLSCAKSRKRLQHARPPCPSLTPRICSNSRPSSRWRHPTISSSVVPFSSCPQSFPASGSFPISQFFTSGGQSTGVSASASVLPMNIQDWFSLRIDWFDLLYSNIKLKVKKKQQGCD